MEQMIKDVKAFHQLVDCDHTQKMKSNVVFDFTLISADLLGAAEYLQGFASHEDKRYLRAHLLCEELGEFLHALSLGKEVEALDGLVDLLYVLIGTAITFNWPLIEAFNEVHRSNMTKRPQENDPHKARVRDKGPEYSPANLKAVLERTRNV